MLLAWQATVDGRDAEALRLRDEAAAKFPQDKESVFWAGDIRFHQGDMAGAMPLFERALALDPDYRLALEHGVLALGWLGRHEDALAWARRWADAARDVESRRAVGRELLALGREEEAEAAYRDAAGGDGPAAYPEVVSYLAQRGRVREAEERARRAVEARARSGPPRDEDERKLARAERDALASVLVLQGRLAEARAVREETAAGSARELVLYRVGFALGTRSAADARAAVEALRAARLDAEPTPTVQAGLALALAGDAEAARALVRPVREGPRWASVPEPMRVFFEAVLAHREGRDAEAEAALRGMREKVKSPDVQYQTAVALGEWALGRGRPREALEPLEQAIAFRWLPESGAWAWLHPRALYLSALAAEELGDRERARTRLDALLALRRRADPDAPLLAEARALRRRLTGG
jgi:tetratricopeptide (TPR) repeat protein